MPGSIAHTITKLALLIDGDNVSATYMPFIVREAEKIGVIAVRRIYGQFKSGKMKSWLKHIETFGLTPVNVSPLTHGKNATDMKLVIEAMDMLHGRNLDGICIASSDGDFTPLAARFRGNAIAVYGFGAKKAPAGYKAEFDRFFECDTLIAAEKKAAPKRTVASPSGLPAALVAPAQPRVSTSRGRRAPETAAPKKPAPEPKALSPAPGRGGKLPVPEAVREQILTVIDRATGKDGYAHVRSVGNTISRAIPDFSAKPYGHGTTAGLLRALPGVEMKEGSSVLIRRKPD